MNGADVDPAFDGGRPTEGDVDEISPIRSAGVLVTACTQGYAQQHGKSHRVEERPSEGSLVTNRPNARRDGGEVRSSDEAL
jgi:hypothetical protein